MALVDLPSLTLVAGTAQTIDLSGQNLEFPCAIKLQNESSLTLKVQIGDDRHTLGAWMVDVFSLRGRDTIRIEPSQLQSPGPAAVPSAVLLPTLASERGDVIPGTYPAALARVITNLGKRPWDVIANAWVNPGATVRGVLIFAAVVGLKYLVNAFTFTTVQTGTTATGANTDIFNGSEILANKIWSHVSGVQGVIGDKDRNIQTDQGLVGSANTALQLSFATNGVTGLFQSITAGVWLVSP